MHKIIRINTVWKHGNILMISFLMSVLNFVAWDRPMGNGTSLESTKPFCCRNILYGNIYLNINHNLIITAQNDHMTVIPPAKRTPPELKLVCSSIPCFLNISREFHKSYEKRVPPLPRIGSASTGHNSCW